ncbi:chemotaxis protein, partial [Pseudomonas syringae pv. tagetis]
ELIHRTLYERTADVRRRATDASLAEELITPPPQKRAHSSERHGVILDSYTQNLDFSVADTTGSLIASGRPGTNGKV